MEVKLMLLIAGIVGYTIATGVSSVQESLEVTRLNGEIKQLEQHISKSDKAISSAKQVLKKRDDKVKEFCKTYGIN